MKRTFAICMVIASGLTVRGEDTQHADSEQAAFFENKVRPLLVDKCYECHSGDETEASLALDSRQGWQDGGDSGAAIVAGDPDKSLIMDAVRYTEERVMGMPPDSRLTDAELQILEQWIASGAYDPREATATTGKRKQFDLDERFETHWSWRPIADPEPPQLENDDWSRDDVDRFILARLREANLQPADDADPLVWLRRVSFDLVGLPPTLEQIRRINSDRSDEAKRQLVDEMLDSPRFGEKWARHWLDLVRYADTFGHEFDYPISNAFRYRDYLIDALNEDVPYDRLVREHLAGDLLKSPRPHPTQGYDQSVLGTGFWYLHESTHAPTDVLQNEADTFSNQIDVFGKTFLGLTIACARCHDHKFDAISTADYYAMQAMLESSCRQDIPLDPHGKRRALAEQMDAVRSEFAAYVNKTPKPTDDELGNAFAELAERHQGFNEERWNAYSSQATEMVDFCGCELPEGWTTTGIAFQSVDDSLRYALSAVPEGHRAGTIDSGVYGNTAHGTLRSPTFEITSPRIDIWMRGGPESTVRLIIDHYEMAKFSALLFAGTNREKGQVDTGGEFRWISLDGDLKKYIGHQAYLEFTDAGNGSIAVDQIWTSEHAPQSPPPSFVQKQSAEEAIAECKRKLAAGESDLLARQWIASQSSPDFAKRLSDLTGQWQRPPMALGMAAGTRQSSPIYIRGGHSNHGDLVEPRNLSAFGGQAGSRLDLANEIATLENPLTARVRVNRVWHHLFGRGIVTSLDDFGPQGTEPTHPLLLDYLATEFAEDGWSLKRLIRRLVLSRTYGQSVVGNAANDANQIAEADPTNALLHRMNLRRLDAEMIRDGILHSAGSLSEQMYGEPIPTHRTAFMTGRGARESGPLDGNGRRTIYQAVYRNFLNPLLVTFDMPNPFGPKGRRSQSNVPAQSLVMMNSPFVVDQSTRWAKRIESDPRPLREKIEEMAMKAHGQPLSDQSIDKMLEFVDSQTQARQGDRTAALADLAQSMWAMKRFFYLQ
ncbi:PSD1 and planctomycete cytochrome C domain-containing protein [Rhodopirellula sp. MGV]|uniref:PSD1 and planctomycete cytochrome C domain-containing protein n=1 Tax=Rhodopirellula sp. MGV TaxID=2023130 RepID=UPI000B97ADFA|nr:PSD1 and planctomycete cytochrome C domain-containing protein [Rhodopirellula sp. MGV]OYP28838.1 hypothetical protein CGZ80_25855 [Rhodopirellula sp. MGV]PNY37558.1 DUF1549 domain-containing protein [Rhodopirellula baltica]